MEINQEMLDSLLALSDEEMRAKLLLIANTIGLDDRSMPAQIANMQKVRLLLKSASADDVNRLIRTKLDPEYADILLKMLGGDKP